MNLGQGLLLIGFVGLCCMLGVINGTAPNPVRLAELCEQLGNVVGRPSWLPVPDFALKAVLGEGASVAKFYTPSGP